jgi:secreted trypsin-like serine protease
MRRITALALACVAVLVLGAAPDLPGSDLAAARAAAPKIIGGTEATPGQWPFMGVMVKAGGDLYKDMLCGASLIARRWVITAAHCVNGRSPSSIEIVFGVHNLKTDAGERFNVKQIIIHPDFDANTLNADLALLELYENCDYTPVPVIDQDLTLTGQMGTVLGWGDISLTQTVYPEALQQVSLPIVSNSDCNKAYNKLPWYYNPVTGNMMCAGYITGGKDSCYGDSGGPLLVQMDGAWKLAGLVSWGEGCADPGFYGVYTRVSKFMDFIETTTTPEQYSVYLPHITAGADDWKDFLQADNNADQSSDYTLTLYSNGEVIYDQTRTLAALGREKMDLKALAPTAACGKITYTDARMHFRYSSENLTGGGVSEFSIPQGLATGLVFYFSDVLPGVEWKGLALANMSDVSARVTLSAIAQGDVLAETALTVNPRNKVVGLYSQWFPGVSVDQVSRVRVVSGNSSLCGLSVSGNAPATTLVVMPAVPIEE